MIFAIARTTNVIAKIDKVEKNLSQHANLENTFTKKKIKTKVRFVCYHHLLIWIFQYWRIVSTE